MARILKIALVGAMVGVLGVTAWHFIAPEKETLRLVVPDNLTPYDALLGVFPDVGRGAVKFTATSHEVFNFAPLLGIYNFSGEERSLILLTPMEDLAAGCCATGVINKTLVAFYYPFHLRNGRIFRFGPNSESIGIPFALLVVKYVNESSALQGYAIQAGKRGETITGGVRHSVAIYPAGKFLIFYQCDVSLLGLSEICDDAIGRVIDKYGQPIATPRAS